MWKDRTTRYSARRTVDRPTRLILAALLALSTPTILARQPPRLGGQPLRDAKEENRDPTLHIAALDARWLATFDTAAAAPPGFDEQSAYLPVKSGELIAVGLDRGEVRWKVQLATAFSPATGDGLVFIAGDGVVVALEEGTGSTVWRTPVGGALAASVHFDAGSVIATTTAGELLTLRGQDGREIWRRPLGSPLNVAPSAAGDRLYAGLKDGRVLALERDTGHQVWSHALGAGEAITGVLALDDQVVVGTRGNRVYSLGLEKGRRRWDWRVGADVSGAAVADEDHIYFAALDNVLRALNRRNGNLQWTQPLPSRPAGGPLRTGDVVIVPTVSADIGAYLAKTGTPAFTVKAAGELGGVPFLREMPRPTAPRLVAVSRDGTLQGFAPRYEPPPVPLDPLPGVKVGG